MAETDSAPRHARKRPAPAARARDKQAAKAPRQAVRAEQRAKLASTGARATPEGAALYAGEKAGSAARTAGRTAASARIIPGDRGYQPVLLAEFLAAVVIIAVIPVATGGSDTAKAKGSLSPYDTGDLRQLVAIGGVYFVLALLSSGNSGRLSAWFGGLVLLAVAFGKVANGGISAVFTPVTGGLAKFGKTADPYASGSGQ